MYASVCTCACPYTCMFVCAQLGTAYRRLWMTSARKMLQQLCAWSFTSHVWMTQSEYIHLINNLYFLPSVTKSDISFYWLTLCHRLSFYCICMITSDDVLLKQCAYIFVCVHVHLYIHVCVLVCFRIFSASCILYALAEFQEKQVLKCTSHRPLVSRFLLFLLAVSTLESIFIALNPHQFLLLIFSMVESG